MHLKKGSYKFSINHCLYTAWHWCTSNKAKLNQAEALFINSYPFRTSTNAYLGMIAGYGVI